ncbi:hypothetical protein, partial [uncultured Dubosiella sp.]|uniref:hypothetical protein n=1 Tax=uncultured Dubosiella sp. TaxID=1937011 RepID=UPI00272A0C56
EGLKGNWKEGNQTKEAKHRFGSFAFWGSKIETRNGEVVRCGFLLYPSLQLNKHHPRNDTVFPSFFLRKEFL